MIISYSICICQCMCAAGTSLEVKSRISRTHVPMPAKLIFKKEEIKYVLRYETYWYNLKVE